MRVVIIGGGSAGTTCAFELRKLNKDIEIIIMEKTNYCEYSPCALPYVINDEITDWKNLFIFTTEDYAKNNIKLFLNCEVYQIKEQKVFYQTTDGAAELNYDKLIIATGAVGVVPDITGINAVDYLSLKTIDDAKKIKTKLSPNSHSVVIGGGMIGMELAGALAESGEQVTVIEQKAHVMNNILDNELAQSLQDYLSNINIITQNKIVEVTKDTIVLDDQTLNYDKLFVCSGCKPNLALAQEMGLKINKGIVVDDNFQTSQANVYAIGDCIAQTEFNTNEAIVSQLGSLAALQARSLANIILGKPAQRTAVLNNAVSKLGDIYVGSVGLTQARANEVGLKTITARYNGNLRAQYYSTAEKISVQLVVDTNGVIVGGQIISHGEIAGRLNLLALAIKNKMLVRDLCQLETCYNPTVVGIFDPLVLAAEIAVKKVSFWKNK